MKVRVISPNIQTRGDVRSECRGVLRKDVLLRHTHVTYWGTTDFAILQIQIVWMTGYYTFLFIALEQLNTVFKTSSDRSASPEHTYVDNTNECPPSISGVLSRGQVKHLLARGKENI